jgi:hypothetical protein
MFQANTKSTMYPWKESNDMYPLGILNNSILSFQQTKSDILLYNTHMALIPTPNPVLRLKNSTLTPPPELMIPDKDCTVGVAGMEAAAGLHIYMLYNELEERVLQIQ